MLKAIFQRTFGGHEAYEFITTKIPTPNSDQFCMKIYCAGVNPVDTYIRQGNLGYRETQLPMIPGHDCGGIVYSAGKDVAEKFPLGTKVWVLMNKHFGAYSQYAIITPGKDFVGVLNENMTYEQGAAIGIPYMTSMVALDKAKAASGQTIVIHGASGGVGIALCNIASYMGCNVVATVGTELGEKNALKSGAESVFYHNKEGYVTEMINYAKEKFGQIDTVIDNAAHININSDVEMVKPGGNIVIIGCRGSPVTNIRMMMVKSLTIYAVLLLDAGEENLTKYCNQINQMISEGAINPICISYPMEKVTDAQTEVITPSKGGAQGKVVLTMF